MGSLNSTLRLQLSSLLWFALPLSPLPSQRPRLTLRLIPGWPMVMVPIPMPMEDTATATAILIPTATTERDLLMPSLRLMLMPSSMDMGPIPMLTLDSTTATLDTTLDTHMPTTTERDLLMLSLRLRPIPPSCTPALVMVPIIPMLTLDSTTATLDTLMPTTTERGPPMLSPRLMPMPTTDATGDTTMDKSSSRVPSKSSTRTSLLVNLTFHPSVRLLGGVGN